MTQKKPKIKIGIVGEHPNNDAESLKHLLQKVAKKGVEFQIFQKNKRGSQLDAASFAVDLRAEFRSEAPQYIILVRDLDGLLSQTDLVRNKDEWFRKANKAIDEKGVFFLAIYEMEALILSDVAVLKKIYGLTVKPVGNPMMKEDSKGHLKKLTEKSQKGKYDVNHALDIFRSLDFKTVYDTHKGERSFQSFADELKDKNIINFK
jgi:Domain of unknown function (DUF4276)